MNRIALLASLAALAIGGQAQAQMVDFTTMTLNGSGWMPTATANDLTLNNGNGGEATSAFLPTAFNTTGGLAGSFDFTLLSNGFNPQADGLALMFQNDPAGANALGGGGGTIGAGGIQNAVGIGFQSWYNEAASIFTTAEGPYGGSRTYFSLGGNAADHVHVTFSYSGGILSYTASNSDTGQNIANSRMITLPSSAFIGFTGGSGLSYAFQDVSNFNLNTAPVPEPESWAMMIAGMSLLGAVLRRRRGVAETVTTV
ncbi:MAG: PEPxxWA-CTERM sorting domain-containing protein [Proteobacteria bacterium]|nr:PEPxxWA-CTERM sorting domain-containing protein [Pseudomonadota bacterium]HQR04654.1 PEPxxWA-CTERM sorting domain-containing protein [Rhodocyclaceae bacterium]